MRTQALFVCASMLALATMHAACSSDPAPVDADAGADAASTDAKPDVSPPADAAPDAPLDAGTQLPASCLAIKQAQGASPDGAYEIDPDGVGALPKRSVYCDMTFDGGGWTLIESYAPGGTNKGPAGLVDDGGTPLNPDPLPKVSGALPRPVVAALASTAKQVHVRTDPSFDADGGQWITSKTSAPQIVANLKAFKVLNRGTLADGGKPWELFDGPNATFDRLNWANDGFLGCTDQLVEAEGYPSIYWACGNTGGFHVVKGQATWNAANANAPLEVFVR